LEWMRKRAPSSGWSETPEHRTAGGRPPAPAQWPTACRSPRGTRHCRPGPGARQTGPLLDRGLAFLVTRVRLAHDNQRHRSRSACLQDQGPAGSGRLPENAVADDRLAHEIRIGGEPLQQLDRYVLQQVPRFCVAPKVARPAASRPNRSMVPGPVQVERERSQTPQRLSESFAQVGASRVTCLTSARLIYPSPSVHAGHENRPSPLGEGHRVES
jgi:hypothetical protein